MSEIEDKNLEEVLELAEKLEDIRKSGHEFTKDEIKEYSEKLGVTEEEFIEGMKENAMEEEVEEEVEEELSDKEIIQLMEKQQSDFINLIKEGHVFSDEEVTEYSIIMGLDEEMIRDAIEAGPDNETPKSQQGKTTMEKLSIFGMIVRFFKNLFN